MKQSSIEWYAEQLSIFGFPVSVIDHWTNEAKQMHNQEIEDACKEFLDITLPDGVCEEYYNETFKTE